MGYLKITERGWPGHFLSSHSCLYRRNTLIEYKENKVVVSTVGNMRPNLGRVEIIGADRYYETMAFVARQDGKYLDADLEKKVEFGSNWKITKMSDDCDMLADKMHEQVVSEIIHDLIIKKLKIQEI